MPIGPWHRTRFGTSYLRTFASATLGSAEQPCLHCKAHDVRVIVGWLAGQAERAPDVGAHHGGQRRALAWMQRELREALEAAPRYLVNPDDLRRITSAAYAFLDLYVGLAEAERARGSTKWNLLRKVHPFIHMIEDMNQDLHNPRFYSGWTDETLMNKVVKMASDSDSRSAICNVLTSWWPTFVLHARELLAASS